MNILRALLSVMLLAGCAPVVTNPPRVSVQKKPETLSYHPVEQGLINEYLEDGERADAPRLKVENLGFASDGEQIQVLVRRYGRGLDELRYLLVTESGIQLAKEDRGQNVITYNPPILLFPATELAAGQSWQGESVLTVANHPDQPQGSLRYRYDVIEERPLVLTLGKTVTTVNAFVLSETQIYTEAGTDPVNTHSTFWYTPYLGEVRTRSGAFIVGTNLF